MSLSPEQIAAIQAAVTASVSAAMTAERDRAKLGLDSAVPRGPGAAPPAAVKLDKPAGEHEAHPVLGPMVIKVGDVWVNHLDGEIHDLSGQRIGRRVDVLHPVPSA